jgi:hypothetical protein
LPAHASPEVVVLGADFPVLGKTLRQPPFGFSQYREIGSVNVPGQSLEVGRAWPQSVREDQV